MILVTGASGYIGGRLLRLLEETGQEVRCLARNPDALQGKVGPTTQVVAANVLDYTSLERALNGVCTAFYLVHSMGSSRGFEDEDRTGAENFARAARNQGVGRIVYLGGLGAGDEWLSPHLRSRHEVGAILRASGVQTLEFRASIIIGSGSLSFELVRALVEKLPVMVTPRWVSALAQPIGVEDMLAYLMAALDYHDSNSAVFEIGGPERVSYLELMREYAKQRGLRRWMFRVPVLTARLSSLWLGLVTPLYARVGRKLIDSLRHDTVVNDKRALSAFPVRPVGYRQAIRRALVNENRNFAETRWPDALSARGTVPAWAGVRFGERIVESRSARADCQPATAFATVEALGGASGWHYGNWLWQLRGFIDLLVGGVGVRRGRPHRQRLAVGDAVDFWRVERIDRGRCLRLEAEMKLPGRAWLQFEVNPEEGRCRIVQTAIFDPVGLWGQLYWYALYPLHLHLFRNMLHRLVQVAEAGPVRRHPAVDLNCT